MSDRDDRGSAWRVPPSAYLARRPPGFAVPRPRSLYLTMPDRCRLALDVYLPEGPEAPARRPAICVFTPYYRRAALAPGATGSEPSSSIFTEVEAGGRERYVTEGVLRALYRKDAADTPAHRTKWPIHSFRHEDAAPLVPGEPARLRIALLPVSWRFRRGSRIRLSIAGADADHFVQVPHGRPPTLTLHHGGAMPSRLDLPLRTQGTARE